MRHFHRAAAGELDPFILVVEGSIPNERLKTEGYWAGFGTDRATDQPITTCEWIDRLAPRAVLRGGQVAPDQIPHALEVIERNARAQVQLVEDILDVSRIITGKLRLDVKPCSWRP